MEYKPTEEQIEAEKRVALEALLALLPWEGPTLHWFKYLMGAEKAGLISRDERLGLYGYSWQSYAEYYVKNGHTILGHKL